LGDRLLDWALDAIRDGTWLRGRSTKESPQGIDAEGIDTAWRAVSPLSSTASRSALATWWGPYGEVKRDPAGRLLRTGASDASAVPRADHRAIGSSVEAEPLLGNRSREPQASAISGVDHGLSWRFAGGGCDCAVCCGICFDGCRCGCGNCRGSCTGAVTGSRSGGTCGCAHFAICCNSSGRSCGCGLC
jgi:hypothetical protein